MALLVNIHHSMMNAIIFILSSSEKKNCLNLLNLWSFSALGSKNSLIQFQFHLTIQGHSQVGILERLFQKLWYLAAMWFQNLFLFISCGKTASKSNVLAKEVFTKHEKTKKNKKKNNYWILCSVKYYTNSRGQQGCPKFLYKSVWNNGNQWKGTHAQILYLKTYTTPID